MRRFILIPFLTIFVFLVPSRKIALAEGVTVWGLQGVPVCTEIGDQKKIRMTSDNFGGAIIVWEDYRGGSDFDIYAHRISSDGIPSWNPGVVAVSTATNSQLNPVVVGDYGQAIIAWEDYRSGVSNIYAQKIDGMGVPSWIIDGKVLAGPSTQNQLNPDIAPDGSGGAVVVWQETDGVNYYVKAQRVDSAGGFPWGLLGIVVSSGLAPKEFPKTVNDGGMFMITWYDFRNGNCDIYAQRLDINGNIASGWDVNGSTVTLAIGDQKEPKIVPDGFGGAIIVWMDLRDPVRYPDIYAQRISSGGVRLWYDEYGKLDGIPVCLINGEQKNPFITSSFIGGVIDGAIIIWEDGRYDANGDIYAVKVGLDEGGYDLTLGGKEIAIGSRFQRSPRLVSDKQGGGIGTWIESDSLTGPHEIFAQRGDQDGNLVWNSFPGVLVCEGPEIMDSQIIGDGYGGAIVAWEVKGPGGNYDIFAQKVVEGGALGYASICGRVTHSDLETGITGVEVAAFKDGELKSRAITDIYGKYSLTGLVAYSTYTIGATWWANGIESSVSKEAYAPSRYFDFTLEVDYQLGTIAGVVSGIEKKYIASLSSLETKSISGAALQNLTSPGSGIPFVELEQRGMTIVRVPVGSEGSYTIPNLLPGRFIARAYNGNIYSSPRTVELKEGETLRIDFAFGIMPEETVYNYPNPAKNGSTTIRYYCGYSEPEAEIKIYNMSGELVRKVKDIEIDNTGAPIYKFLWDCRNSSGKEVASGIYIFTVEVKEKNGSGDKKVIKRMAIIR